MSQEGAQHGLGRLGRSRAGLRMGTSPSPHPGLSAAFWKESLCFSVQLGVGGKGCATPAAQGDPGAQKDKIKRRHCLSKVEDRPPV